MKDSFPSDLCKSEIFIEVASILRYDAKQAKQIVTVTSKKMSKNLKIV